MNTGILKAVHFTHCVVLADFILRLAQNTFHSHWEPAGPSLAGFSFLQHSAVIAVQFKILPLEWGKSQKPNNY